MNLDKDYFEKKEKTDSSKRTIEEIVKETGDEQLLWSGKPNKKIFILERILKMMPVALLWLAVDAGFLTFFFIAFAHHKIPTFLLAIVIPFFCIHLIPVWIWIFHVVTASIRLKHTEYGFTDKRIIIKSGLFVDVVSVYYADISSVKLNVGFLDRIFKVGDIQLFSSNGIHVLEDLSDPYFLTDKLQKIVLDIKADIQFPNDLRPSENNGYNTKYTRKKD